MDEMQTIEWLGMRLRVPRRWEIVRHSVRPERGRLTLVDRRHQRLQLSWAALERPPDFRRTFSDYRAREQEKDERRRFVDLPARAGWRGFRRTGPGEALSRAGRYLKELGRWVEIVLVWPDGVEPSLERRVLESFEAEVLNGKPIRWRAFGLDVKTPAGWTLVDATVKPADSQLAFREGRRSGDVRRLGAADAWFDGNLSQWIQKEAGSEQTSLSPAHVRGHDACLAEGFDERGLLPRLRWGRDRRLDLVWHCPNRQALFQVTTRGPAKSLVRPDAFVVRCCDSGGEEG